jgi:creatinine amidohydrolase
MQISEVNWMQVEEYLRRDDRIVLPVGSTEQHAHLSLATDSILAERVSVEAAEPLGVLVLPAMPFGVAPGFAAFPGTVSLRPETLVAVVSEVLDTLYGQGFRRFLVVNGHGGNEAAREPLEAWPADRDGARLRFHSWWDSSAVQPRATSTRERPRTPPGSRASRGRGSPASSCPPARSPWSPTGTRSASSSRAR